MVLGVNRTLIVKMIHSSIVWPMCSNTPRIDWNLIDCAHDGSLLRHQVVLWLPSLVHRLSLSYTHTHLHQSWVGGVVELPAVPIHGPFATPCQLSLSYFAGSCISDAGGLGSAHVSIPHYSAIYYKRGPCDWPWLVINIGREMWNLVAIRQLQMKDVDLNVVTLLSWIRIFLEWHVARVIKNGQPRTRVVMGLEYVIKI